MRRLDVGPGRVSVCSCSIAPGTRWFGTPPSSGSRRRWPRTATCCHARCSPTAVRSTARASRSLTQGHLQAARAARSAALDHDSSQWSVRRCLRSQRSPALSIPGHGPGACGQPRPAVRDAGAVAAGLPARPGSRTIRPRLARVRRRGPPGGTHLYRGGRRGATPLAGRTLIVTRHARRHRGRTGAGTPPPRCVGASTIARSGSAYWMPTGANARSADSATQSCSTRRT